LVLDFDQISKGTQKQDDLKLNFSPNNLKDMSANKIIQDILEQICLGKEENGMIEIKFKNFFLANVDYLHKFLDNLSFNYSLQEQE
jgi:hypothetical protein